MSSVSESENKNVKLKICLCSNYDLWNYLASISTCLFTARKRKFGARLYFYTCLSFCSRGGEYLTPPRDKVHPPGPGTPPWDQVHPPGTRYTPWDQVHPPATRYTPWDQVHPPGTRYTPPDQVHPPDHVPPPVQSMLGDTVNTRAVRILLECNLVV